MSLNAVNFKLVRPGAQLPKRGTPGSGGLDIYAPEAGVIEPGQRATVPTGLAHQINHGQFSVMVNGVFPLFIPFKLQGILIPRSGLAGKKGVRLFFAPCLIDEDYRGEIMIVLENCSNEPLSWNVGDRLCQIAYVPMYMGGVGEVSELDDTERGAGGFGSTGMA